MQVGDFLVWLHNVDTDLSFPAKDFVGNQLYSAPVEKISELYSP